MPKDHRGAIPYSEFDSPYATAFRAALAALRLSNPHSNEGDLRDMARDQVSRARDAEITAADAAATVEALGIIYGTPAAKPAAAELAAVDHGWGLIVAKTNSQR